MSTHAVCNANKSTIGEKKKRTLKTIFYAKR